MRHQVSGRKLGRTTSHREAMFRNMVVSLIQHGRIVTTLEKAKELRIIADKIITLGKKDTLHARRLAFDRLRSRDAVQKLFATIAPAFKARSGGYTRILKIGHRHGDGGTTAIIEYLREDVGLANLEEKQAKAEKAKPAKKTAEPKAKKEAKPVAAEKAKKEPKAVKAPKAKAAATKSKKKDA